MRQKLIFEEIFVSICYRHVCLRINVCDALTPQSTSLMLQSETLLSFYSFLIDSYIKERKTKTFMTIYSNFKVVSRTIGSLKATVYA